MASKKNGLLGVPKTARAALEATAKVLGVAVTELWIIFVRQYVVKGLAQLFTAGILTGLAFFLWNQYSQTLFTGIPALGAIIFTYGAIANLGNPRYYAIEDIVERVKEFSEKDNSAKTDTTSRSNSSYRGY